MLYVIEHMVFLSVIIIKFIQYEEPDLSQL